MPRASARTARLGAALLTTLAVLLSVTPTASATSAVWGRGGRPPVGESGNPAPKVVPALREWSGGQGTLALGQGSRIVVDDGNEKTLTDEARTLRDELAEVAGLDVPMVSASHPRDGDIFLSVQGADRELGPEGYALDVGNVAVIRANDDTGVFYGTQTLLQALRTTPGHRALPRGEARDWPKQRERGYLLDAGRKYYSPDFVVQTIREMSYLRLNTLQLHLSDHNAFRLVSERHPWLAAPQAYTRADIRRFEAAARTYHVTLIPEIEMPSHASAILKGRPDLAFPCQALSGGTLDVTNPEARKFTAGLIEEFAPLFSGPEFHIATDEYARQAEQEKCPQLVKYAKEHGFGSTADVFVDYINEMNKVVRSQGKRMVIWNWWDVDQTPTIHPDKNIKVEAWTTGGETSEDHSPQKYLDQGYEVVVSASDTLYVTPGFPLLPDAKYLYEKWTPQQHPRLSGYLISVWSDNAITRPDSYFDAYLRRPREVLADRLWGGPRDGTVEDFFARADAIGTPPGVPEYALPGRLTGTPYGTSPAWDHSSSTFDKAFDSEPGTNFLYAEPSGGYTGIDLGADHASRVSLVRFFPGANDTELDRMTGGRFEGCTDGPADGCRTLATVKDRPEFGWNELAVDNPARFRWLRYVSPDDGYSSVAEIEFIAPPGGSDHVSVEGPSELRQLGDNRVVTSYRNNSDHPLHDVRLSLAAESTQDRTTRQVRALDASRFAAVKPGQTVSTRWKVTVPLDAATGIYHLVGRAGYQDQQGKGEPRHESVGFTRSTLGQALTARLGPEAVGLDAGDSAGTQLQVTNHAAATVEVAWNEVRSPTANPGYTIRAATGTVRVPPGGTTSAHLTATASGNADGPTAPLRLDLTASSAGQPEIRAGSVELRIHSRLHPYLSDLDWSEATSEWDVVTRDTYVGSSDPMTLNGVRYQKGLGAAGNSKVSFDLGKKCSRLTATIGIDDAADSSTDGGTSHFFVFVDGKKVYESGLITRETVKDVDVDVSGADTLSLVTDNAGDGFDHDAVDWADALVHCS
ncbi:family 20 glycosylhydrolase [Streptomyces sp. NPDC002205]|uniref:family 20 glycosylhydrolase n=1 Tax=Streptomyces sp. NPDC002205 TaxID=3154411 RepID=UPI003317FC28